MRNFPSPYSDRISKLSEKLSNLSSSISIDQSDRMETVESQLSIVEQNFLESHQTLSDKFANLKNDISSIKSGIDDDRLARERHINQKLADVRRFSENFAKKVEEETLTRKELEGQLYRQVEQRSNTIRQDLLHEFKQSIIGAERQQTEIANRLRPIEGSVNDSQNSIKDVEARLKELVEEGVEKLSESVMVEKSCREETEDALLQMLKDVIGRVKHDLDIERKEREDTEENLLNLLEEACSKLTQI